METLTETGRARTIVSNLDTIDVTKVLCVKNELADASQLPLKTGPNVQVTFVSSAAEALARLQEEDFDGLYYCQGSDPQHPVGDLIQNMEMLDWVPDGLALLDDRNRIVKTNRRLASWFEESNLVGLDFYEALGRPDIVGNEPSPLATARRLKRPSTATLKLGERYFRLEVVPMLDQSETIRFVLVSLSDSTTTELNQQKLEALHKAGTALADLRPEEIYQMDVDERIDLLKDNILHYTRDLLDFDVIEIRLVDRSTGLLIPLLSEGIDSEQSTKPLYAKSTGNGVTGFVTATGQSYLCEDTTQDPLYLDGLVGAKSSLTVPLVYHDEVIGSFNVESPEINTFNDSDVRFLESFAHDIAVSLNTLELLNAQRTDAALQSVSAIHDAVHAPINEILNDTVHAIESYIGHDPEVTRRLRTILSHARQIKRSIQQVGQEMAPVESVPSSVQSEVRPELKDKCILVIDADEQVRHSAHQLLSKFGCDVETAHEGNEALMMVRNCEPEGGYDAIIADIRLPDIGGYDLLMKLRDIVPEPPLILMTGFGYDPGHSIVKARQAGLRSNAVLFKPFRVDQLVEVVESIVKDPVEPSSSAEGLSG